jgi:cold shock CspA family protein
MGRSQETFSKKENEKKKQQKKKEKEERKEERKANNKGQTFEDMIAYVDENGNISSQVPDLKKKKTVSQESIQIGVARQEPGEAQVTTRKGKVTFFNESKGYGFIKDLDSQESIFVHLKGLVDRIKENDKVTFEVERTSKGLSAIDVKLAK